MILDNFSLKLQMIKKNRTHKLKIIVTVFVNVSLEIEYETFSYGKFITYLYLAPNIRNLFSKEKTSKIRN